MIGIYKESFIDYLKENLGYAKMSRKSIITKCPYCELNKEKKHYHLYIALEFPGFRCWHAKCLRTGSISKLTAFIEGRDRTDEFVDKSLIKKNERKLGNPLKEKKPLIIPEIDTDKFKLKTMYMKYRFGFDIDVTSINKLVFDFEEFVKLNNIELDEKATKMGDFLQNNFVGFVTQRDSLLVMRNIDPKADFRYYKINLHEEEFLDYYKIQGNCFDSYKVVLAEGVFDIYAEHKFDSLKIRDSVKLYAATLSGSFSSLLKSIVFYEQLYRMDVVILSHMDIGIDTYEKLKKYDNHIINTLNVYYNKTGKDFSSFPVSPEKIVM